MEKIREEVDRAVEDAGQTAAVVSVMLPKLLSVCLIGCVVMALGGCAMRTGSGIGQSVKATPETAKYDYVPNTVPDDYQVQVARELGCSANQIAAMQKDGMSARDYSNLVPAADMLKKMEDRYGIDFRADWVNSGSSWAIGCTAEDGPHAGESFTVETFAQNDGSLKYVDDYYGAYRSADFEAFMDNAVEQALNDVGLHGYDYALQAKLEQSIDQSVPLDDPISGGAGDYYGTCNLLFYGSKGPDESQGKNLANALVDQIANQGVRSSFFVAYYPDCNDEASALAGISSRESAWYVLKAM